MSNDMKMQSRTVPANFGPLRDANGNARINGPCGDTMEFWLRIDDDRITGASYTTDGCQFSVLCGSVAARLAAGMPLHMVRELQQQDVLNAAEGTPKESEHCALLAVRTLAAAIEDYDSRHPKSASCDRGSMDCGSCDKEGCASRSGGETPQTHTDNDDWMLAARLSRIRHKLVVLSGKGGVGKSTVAINLAMTLAERGKRVGLLDVDIHGPSVPTMLGLTGRMAQSDNAGIVPEQVGNLLVMSIGLLLRQRDDAVIWRGPMKANLIRQFLKDVNWGELDYLVIDCPPGTGDEPLSVCQFLDKPSAAVIVTTPQEVAAADVRKSVNFCLQLGMPVLGVIENMSGFVCPDCGSTTDIFRTGGGRNVANTFDIPFLGRIPIDPAVSCACDDGTPFVSRFARSAAAEAFAGIASQLIESVENGKNTLS